MYAFSALLPGAQGGLFPLRYTDTLTDADPITNAVAELVTIVDLHAISHTKLIGFLEPEPDKESECLTNTIAVWYPISDDFTELVAQPVRDVYPESFSDSVSVEQHVGFTKRNPEPIVDANSVVICQRIPECVPDTVCIAVVDAVSDCERDPLTDEDPKSFWIPDQNSNAVADTKSIAEPYSDTITDTNADCIANGDLDAVNYADRDSVSIKVAVLDGVSDAERNVQ